MQASPFAHCASSRAIAGPKAVSGDASCAMCEEITNGTRPATHPHDAAPYSE